ncbi:putative 2-heptaprenyl-1,4-naphthoquinone methyltransferase [Aspergillus caelatus]|uniref:Putative 2-heptaprenyl-1,4-naphthoquinone methyltransferase n=1 Tax=Aspergillus caelatus TaxID=61420 RepID=A0A5N7A7T1_9EURO|nr:putative 2-heptaprenyl-1,4-naphthoquinone methyltransferase [Aspergillus caelatus]KAE8365911.1 putative 2-heptaprenyl-1,4-naphthoquinone methyltransferase [Aspergillus caelatus]
MTRYPENNSNSLGVLQNPEANKFFDSVVQGLPPQSRVLSVGCGASLPLLSKHSSAHHEIHGIDRSQESIDLVKSQISGHFKLANETEYVPQLTFNAILAILSLSHLSRAQISSLFYKISDWLHPGGSMILATSPSDHANHCVHSHSLQLNGGMTRSTLLNRKEWVTLCGKAGLTLESEVPISVNSGDAHKHHTLMHFRKTVQYSMLGPYPLPESYRGPIPLSEAAWEPFAKRLVRDEFDFVLKVLENNQKVLDVGSGYGKLPMELAARTGKAYSIEPNADRNSIQATNARNCGVEIAQGSAENIPYPDSHFDAVVAMWVMQYVEDLGKSLHEIVRVTDRNAKNSRIVIVQGAPENEIVELQNTACAPVSASNPLPNHQGYLLHKAVQVFTECGFDDITFHRVDAYCEFLEEDISVRCEKAADVVAGLWCLNDERYEEMKQALIPRLRSHFEDRPHAIGDQVAVLVAKPRVSN